MLSSRSVRACASDTLLIVSITLDLFVNIHWLFFVERQIMDQYREHFRK